MKYRLFGATLFLSLAVMAYDGDKEDSHFDEAPEYENVLDSEPEYGGREADPTSPDTVPGEFDYHSDSDSDYSDVADDGSDF